MRLGGKEEEDNEIYSASKLTPVTTEIFLCIFDYKWIFF